MTKSTSKKNDKTTPSHKSEERKKAAPLPGETTVHPYSQGSGDNCSFV